MRKFMTGLAGLALLCSLAGCSDSNDPIAVTHPIVTPQVQGRIVLHDDGQPTTPNGDVADTVEVEAFDAVGKRLYGPVLQPLAEEMVFEGVPTKEVRTVQIDYLRNGGFLLLRATVTEENEQFSIAISDPNAQPVDPNTSRWRVQAKDDGGFDLTTVVGGASVAVNSDVAAQQVRARGEFPVRLKGVCYSPAPIQFKNIDAPSIGDLFWDTTKDVKNWFALWGKGPLPYDQKLAGRDDLSKIRALGCNSLRTYCMLSRQLFVYDDKQNPAFRPGEVPVPPDKFQHFTHKEFLDKCWNNGNDPIYVLVGLPLPPDILYSYGGASPELKAYWDFVLKETVTDVGSHPAVLGFTLFNEIDENRSAWPGVNAQSLTGGEQTAESDFYYGKLKEYSALIKSIAPDKLVGWAAHESQPFLYYGSHVPQGNPYFSQLTDIDYWGVNTYQSKTLEEPLLGDKPGRFGSLTGANRKPVIFTEFGWPGTGHRDPADLNSIYEDASTRANAAAVISDMIPKAYANDLVMGVFYFEFSDEWWKQPPYELFPGDTSRAAAWNGGPSDGGMPNGYHDQEAFGLYSTALGAGRTDPNQSPTANNRPVTPVDTYIPRQELVDALKAAYAAVPSGGPASSH